MMDEQSDLRSGRRGAILFLLIVAGVLAVRVPVMYREPGELDEECYATPGLFVLRDGVPRLPHIPGRAPEAIFYHADTVLFAEPPVSFYIQALFYSVLPPVYGTARLVSLCAGIAVLGLIWALARQWIGGVWAAAWAAGLFSMSRWFFLQAIRARPDVLCTAFGLAAIWAVCRWRQTEQRRWLVLAGVFIGLGGMTHPFALVYAVQIGVWVLIASRGWKRLWQPALVAVVSLLVVAACWLPLILEYPDIFQVQFRNQFLSPRDSLAARALAPWQPVWHHGSMMWHQIKPWQFLLAVVPLTACTVQACRRGAGHVRTLAVLAWSSIYLMALSAGVQHPVPGYWTYPASLMFLCTGWLIDRARWRLDRAGRLGRGIAWTAGAGLVLSMLPQSRVGTLVAHLRHWDDVNYNAPRFARRMMSEVPPEAYCAVDTEFLLDFLASGRRVVLARAGTGSIQANRLPWEYFIGSRMAIENRMIEAMQGELVRTWGDRQDLYACYAELYRPEREQPARAVPQSTAADGETVE